VGLLGISLKNSSEAVSVTLLDRSISYLSIVVLGGVVFFLHQAGRGRRANTCIGEADGTRGGSP
jgi:hypothetical protein